MISKSVCHFCVSWHAPYNVGLPHIVTMGRDEILQQTPLKTPLDRTKYARQSFTPHYDHSLINLIFIG
ncbi:hypothetical protein [Helicobacter pylori]|uniref:hypothetical protein n=1 Tax=Helicobacter pylori TaxID=210 RepID=UPI001F60BB8A|nr:hypothetical protein [Helicobacter pylori]NHB41299.1 hypothetical protein [Helicobacter pylori]